MLINISDHFTRVKANTGSPDVRVYGVLLGSQVGRTVDISNSFEIKHEVDAQGQLQIDVPFLTHKQEQCGCCCCTWGLSGHKLEAGEGWGQPGRPARSAGGGSHKPLGCCGDQAIFHFAFEQLSLQSSITCQPPPT